MSKSHRIQNPVLRSERTQHEAVNRTRIRETQVDMREAMRAGSATAAAQVAQEAERA